MGPRVGGSRSPAAAGDPARSSRALRPAIVRVLVDWSDAAARPGASARARQTRKPAVTGESRPCGAYAGIRKRSSRRSPPSSARRLAASAWCSTYTAYPPGPRSPCTAARAPDSRLRAGARAERARVLPCADRLAARARRAGGRGARTGGALERAQRPRLHEPPASRPAPPGSSPLSVAVYAQLARAMAATLRAAGGTHHRCSASSRLHAGRLARTHEHRAVRRSAPGRGAVPRAGCGRCTRTRAIRPRAPHPTRSPRCRRRSTRAAAARGACRSGSPRPAPARRGPGGRRTPGRRGRGWLRGARATADALVRDPRVRRGLPVHASAKTPTSRWAS